MRKGCKKEVLLWKIRLLPDSTRAKFATVQKEGKNHAEIGKA
jgi:hypothetical protein